MKKIILLLCFIFAGLTYGQFNKSISIQYTDEDQESDSIEVVDVGINAEMISIKFVSDTNAVNLDSVRVRAGTVIVDGNGNPLDTVWATVAVKDSSWSDETILINDGDGAGFQLLSFVNQLLEFRLLNAYSTNPIRKVNITIDVRETK